MAQLGSAASWLRRAVVVATVLSACAVAAEVGEDSSATSSSLALAPTPPILADLEAAGGDDAPHSVDADNEVLTPKPASNDAPPGDVDMPVPPPIEPSSKQQNTTASPTTIAAEGGGALLPPVLVSNNSSDSLGETTTTSAPTNDDNILITASPPTTSRVTTMTPSVEPVTTTAPPVDAPPSAPTTPKPTTSAAAATTAAPTTTSAAPTTTVQSVTTVAQTTTEPTSPPTTARTVAHTTSAAPSETISPAEDVQTTKPGKPPSAVNDSAKGSSRHGPVTSYTTLALVGFSLLCVFIVVRRRNLRASAASGASTGRPSSSGNYAKLSNPHDPVDDDDDLDWQDDPELGSSKSVAGRKRLSPDFNPFSRNQPVPSTPKVVAPLSAAPSTPPPSEPRALPRLHEPINPFAVNHDVFSEFNMVPQVKASALPPPLVSPPAAKLPAIPPPPASTSTLFSMEMDDHADDDASGWDEDDWTQ